MANVVAVTLIKRTPYRGDSTEEWSNKYFFTGAEPADSTAWKALYDALILQEKTCWASTTKAVRAYGYYQDEADDSPAAVDSHDYLAAGATVNGTLASTAGAKIAGDQATFVEWRTSRLNSRGKRIYLRKYFHDVFADTTVADSVSGATTTALNLFGTKMFDGSFLDARTIRSQHHAETIISRTSSPWLTTRTLHRRGRRP